MTGKEAFEKLAESQALGRDEWWIYWPFFKAGVNYERKREKLNAPIVLNRPSARGGEDALRASEQRVGELLKAMNDHNGACQDMCGIGEQEAVACGYRPYFEGSHRRCPTCPVYDKIEIPPAGGEVPK